MGRVSNHESGLGDKYLEGTTAEGWIGMRGLCAGNGHSPHKGLVSAGFDECGAELGAKGQGMAPAGDPRKYGQGPSRTLCPVRRGRTKHRCQGRSADVPFLHALYSGKRHDRSGPQPTSSPAAKEGAEYPRTFSERGGDPWSRLGGLYHSPVGIQPLIDGRDLYFSKSREGCCTRD